MSTRYGETNTQVGPALLPFPGFLAPAVLTEAGYGTRATAK